MQNYAATTLSLQQCCSVYCTNCYILSLWNIIHLCINDDKSFYSVQMCYSFYKGQYSSLLQSYTKYNSNNSLQCGKSFLLGQVTFHIICYIQGLWEAWMQLNMSSPPFSLRTKHASTTEITDTKQFWALLNKTSINNSQPQKRKINKRQVLLALNMR